MEVFYKIALSLVKARREEGKLTKVSKLEDPHLLAYEGFIQNSGNSSNLSNNISRMF